MITQGNNYNNSLQSLLQQIATSNEDLEKLQQYKEKLIAENKPYVSIDIRLNKQLNFIKEVESFIEYSTLLIKELQQELQETRNTKKVEQYINSTPQQRTPIAQLPTTKDYDLHDMIIDLHEELVEIKNLLNK